MKIKPTELAGRTVNGEKERGLKEDTQEICLNRTEMEKTGQRQVPTMVLSAI